MENNLKNLAKQFIVGAYEGNTSIVNKLAAEDIVSTYPIFSEIFNTPVLKGITAYNNFVLGFSQRWKNTNLTIHDEIAEGNSVVLLWSFKANRVSTNQSSRWGGITILRFNNSGKVVAEIGEESDPGPQERLLSLDNQN